MARLSNILKNIVIILVILQFAPLIMKNASKYYTSLFEAHTKVGVITITNAITSPSPYIKQLKTFFEDHDIKAILIKMDCPGGSAGAAQSIFYTLKELKHTYSKLVIVQVINVCASGGYYIAAPADYIIAPASAMIGSIGVYLPQPKLKDFIEQFKIKYDVIKSGTYKTAGNPLLEQTPEQTEMLQELSNDVYTDFVKDVSECRGQLTLATQNNWAQGRVFSGTKALARGLIDEVGSFLHAERAIRQKTPVEGKIIWVKAPHPSALSRFFGSDDDHDDETSLESFCNVLYSWWFKQLPH
jgi:protease IV